MRKKVKSKYIVIDDRHMYIGDSVKDVENQSGLMIEESEFRRIDGNYIVRLTDSDIDFIQDKKRMSNIPWQSMLKKDMTLNYLLYAVIVLNVILLIRG